MVAENAFETDPSSTCCRALNIVLQNWMIPDLGWYGQSIERHLSNLRTDITKLHGGALLGDQENSIKEESLKFRHELINKRLWDIIYFPPNQVSIF